MNSLKTIKVYLLLGLLFAASIFAGGCGSKNTDNNSAETSAQTDISLSEAPVSYTHLMMPTICSV